MAKIGVTHKPSDDYSDGDCEASLAISYITEDVKHILKGLPRFASVIKWDKRLNGVLKDFTFTNLLMYFVYGRDKSFDMQSLKSFKSLKAYKFFYRWLYKKCLGVSVPL